MEIITKEKTCKSCKYYVEHYVIHSTRLYPIGGHCINKNLYNPHSKKPYGLHENCNYWKNNEDVKAERRENIKDVLQSMEQHLFYIKTILDEDDK